VYDVQRVVSVPRISFIHSAVSIQYRRVTVRHTAVAYITLCTCVANASRVKNQALRLLTSGSVTAEYSGVLTEKREGDIRLEKQ